MSNLITALKNILASIVKIIQGIQGRREAKPSVDYLPVQNDTLTGEISLAGMKMLYPILLDAKYYYAKAEDWANLLDYIYFKFDMPKYLVDRFDCEDWAILLKGLVSSFFGLNCFAVVFGKSPRGYHSWNVFRTEEGWLQLEPQTGRFFKMNERDYKADWLLM